MRIARTVTRPLCGDSGCGSAGAASGVVWGQTTTADESAERARSAGDRGHRDASRGIPEQGAHQRHGAHAGRHGRAGASRTSRTSRASPRASTSITPAPMPSPSAASPPRQAPVPPASTSTTRRSRCARSASIPTTPCPRPSTCSAWKCCAARRARSSARAPRAARCATSSPRRAPLAADTYVRSEMSYTQYGQPNGEFGIAHGQPIVDGTFGVRAASGTATTAAGSTVWIGHLSAHRGRHQPQRELQQFNHGAACGRLAAECFGERHAEHPLSAPGQAR